MQEFWQRPVLPQLAAEIEYVTGLMRTRMRIVRIMIARMIALGDTALFKKMNILFE